MLGFRGCRLAIAFPEIAEMQARAIFEGAVAAKTKTGEVVTPEIMVPLVIGKAEFDIVKAVDRRDGRRRRARRPAKRCPISSAR